VEFGCNTYQMKTSSKQRVKSQGFCLFAAML
jgi:hypothetical protein